MATLVFSTLGLVACSNDNYQTNQSITFKGDYSGDGFESNTYSNGDGAKLVLNASTQGTAKFICPSGYVFQSDVAPSYGVKSDDIICNRQGDCDIYAIGYTPNIGFQASADTYEQGVRVAFFNNLSTELLAICVKQDQLSDWT